MLVLLEESYFERLFSTKTIFSPSLFKISSLLLILSTILLFLAPYSLEKCFNNFLQIILHLQVYIFVSKHLNEAWRCNEGPTKEEASLSSRLEDTLG
jgi:hypothetical protein